MRAFLTGAVVAALLAAGTALVLDRSAISSIEAVDNRSILVDDEVGTVADQQ